MTDPNVERRIRRYTDRCVHWQGLLGPGMRDDHRPCGAGLDPVALFDSSRARPGIALRARDWPCNQPAGAACERHCAMPREDAERQVADDAAALNRTLAALRAAHQHFAGQASGAAVIACPSCGGRLHVAKASNGHVRGQCESDGCASWIQ